MLNVLSSIDRVSSGHIQIEGADITQMKDKQLAHFRKNDLGFIFQEYNLLDTLTVKENILLPLSIRNMKKDEVDRQFERVAGELGIHECSGYWCWIFLKRTRLTIIGTYITFKFSVALVLNMIRKSKKGHVNVTDVLSLTRIMFKMKSNA